MAVQVQSDPSINSGLGTDCCLFAVVLQSDKRSSKKFTEFMLYVEPKEMYTMSQSTSPDDGFLTSQTFNDLGKFQVPFEFEPTFIIAHRLDIDHLCN